MCSPAVVANRRMDDMAQVTAEIKAWKMRRDNRQAKVQWHFSTAVTASSCGGYIRRWKCDTTLAHIGRKNRLGPIPSREAVVWKGRPMALSSGTHLGPDEIIALLGAGEWMMSCRARDTRLGRDGGRQAARGSARSWRRTARDGGGSRCCDSSRDEPRFGALVKTVETGGRALDSPHRTSSPPSCLSASFADQESARGGIMTRIVFPSLFVLVWMMGGPGWGQIHPDPPVDRTPSPPSAMYCLTSPTGRPNNTDERISPPRNRRDRGCPR